jgi:hypothetical protein
MRIQGGTIRRWGEVASVPLIVIVICVFVETVKTNRSSKVTNSLLVEMPPWPAL